MHTPSRLVLTAAVAGAALLLPLTAAAPAIAAPADGIPTTARLTITTDAPTVPEGDGAIFHVLLVEGANGDPAGLSGRLVVDRTVGGVTTERVDAVHAPNTVQTLSLDTSRAGAVLITATFVPKTENQSFEKATATITVLAKATVSVLSTTVDAGAAIVAQVGELSGSDSADGELAATAPGLTLSACGPTPTNPEQSACAIPVPKDTPSGTYSVTLTFSGSPRYTDATATIPVTIIGAPAKATTGTGTGSTGSTTSTGTGTSSHRGSASGTGATAGPLAGSTIVSGTTAGDATPSPDVTDTPSSEPTEVAAPLPVAAKPGITTASATTTPLPIPLILLAVAAAGVIGLLMVVLVIVVIVRSRRRARVAG